MYDSSYLSFIILVFISIHFIIKFVFNYIHYIYYSFTVVIYLFVHLFVVFNINFTVFLNINFLLSLHVTFFGDLINRNSPLDV